jgi:hypothetical protein
MRLRKQLSLRQMQVLQLIQTASLTQISLNNRNN